MSLSPARASQLISEARRLFDMACMAESRAGGALASAPLLQKSLYVAASLLLRAHGQAPSDYDEIARDAQRINVATALVPADVSVYLATVRDASARNARVEIADDDRALRDGYREVFLWAPDFLQAVAAATRRRFRRGPAFFERAAWRAPLLAFSTTRAALLVVGMAGERAVPVEHAQVTALPIAAWVEPWVRWDAAWFYSVVVRGYDGLATGQPPNVVFFPLFPVVANVLALPVELATNAEAAYYYAAFFLAHASFLLALVGLRRLGATVVGARASDRATWLVALYPFSFFFSAPYPQALFFALAAWTFVYVAEERWLRAACFASFAAVTFQLGLVLPFLVVIAHRRSTATADIAKPALVWVAGLAAAAPGALLLYFAIRYHDPLVFVREYFSSWGATIGWLHWQQAATFLGHNPPIGEALPFAWSIALVPITLLLIAPIARKLGTTYAAYCAALALFGVFVTVAGFGRFLTGAFPIFLWLGWRLRDRAAFAILCGSFAPTLAYFAFAYCHWSPTGGP
jgi:hypothetical protein